MGTGLGKSCGMLFGVSQTINRPRSYAHYVKRLCTAERQWVCYTNGSANMRRSKNVSDLKRKP